MKRLLAIALCVALCLCLCACDIPFFGKDKTEDTVADAQTTQAASTQGTTVATTTMATTGTTSATTTVATTASNSSGGGLDDLNKKNNAGKSSSSSSSSSKSSSTPAKTTAPATTKSSNSGSSNKSSSGSSSSNQQSGQTPAATKALPQQTSIVYKPGQVSTFESVQNYGHMYNNKKNTIITTAHKDTPAPSPAPAPTGNTPGTTAKPNPTPAPTGNTPGTTAKPNPTPAPTATKATPGTTDKTPGTTGKVPSGGDSKNGVITYPTSSDLATRNDISFKANGVDVALYDVRVNHNHYYNANTVTSTTPVAMFEMESAVEVKITYPYNVTSAVVRPIDKGIKASASGKTVSFTISKAGQYSVEVNGKVEDAVIVFADEPHVAPSGNVTVREKGTHVGYVTPKGSDVIYLAPGAVIRGTLEINNVSGSRICGRGIFDGSTYQSWIKSSARLPVKMWQGNDIELDGFFIFDSNCWGIEVNQTNNVKINNVKIMTARPNGDGISLQSSHDVTVTNCFLRTWDDTLVVKNYGLPLSYNITFKNCVLWNDLANAMEIGYETNKDGKSNPKMYDIHFEDIYVIHGLANSVISIHNGDNAAISKITYKNIYVDTSRASAIIDMNNNYSAIWSKVKERGTINGVTIENLVVHELTMKQTSKIDASSGAIKGVTIKNYTLEGKKVTSASAAGMNVSGGASVTFS
jgi:hypothetical protein